MSDRTDTPSADTLAAALRTLANLSGTLYLPYPGGPTVVQLLAHEDDELRVILPALTEVTHEQQPAGAGTLHRWRGRLISWPLLLVQWLPSEAGAALLAESALLSESAGAELAAAIGRARVGEMPAPAMSAEPLGPGCDGGAWCRCSWPSPCRRPGLWLVDTDPAAAEQPAGLVSSWPLAADDGPAIVRPYVPDVLPQPSWARVGLSAVLAEPFTPLVYPRPVTDPALAGRDEAEAVA